MYYFFLPILLHVRPSDGILNPDSAYTYKKSGREDLNLRPLRPERRFIEFSESDYQTEKHGKTLKIRAPANINDSIILYHF